VGKTIAADSRKKRRNLKVALLVVRKIPKCKGVFHNGLMRPLFLSKGLMISG
jgi:hypothetical protein